jgi:hypothetical protein
MKQIVIEAQTSSQKEGEDDALTGSHGQTRTRKQARRGHEFVAYLPSGVAKPCGGGGGSARRCPVDAETWRGRARDASPGAILTDYPSATP